MLSKHSKSNLSAIFDTKPSLLVHKDTLNDEIVSICVSIYIDLKGPYYCEDPDDYYPSEKETIGYLLATRTGEKINDMPVFQVSGTAGAIAGFGSALYESMLIELSKIENGALLISDRESITSSAEHIYEKLKNNPGFGFFPIHSDSDIYSKTLEYDILPELLSNAGLDPELEYEYYLKAVEAKQIPSYQLNNAYYRKSDKEYEDIHHILLKNHAARKLTPKECDAIISDGEYLGEYIDELSEMCIKDMQDGFKILLRDIPGKEAGLSI